MAEEAGWFGAAWGPLQDATRCSSPPPGAQRYIIYKVLKFGVSWGGHHCLPLGSFFIFRKSLLGLPSSLLGAYAPAPAPPLLLPGQGEGGGTVPVIIKHEFN